MAHPNIGPLSEKPLIPLQTQPEDSKIKGSTITSVAIPIILSLAAIIVGAVLWSQGLSAESIYAGKWLVGIGTGAALLTALISYAILSPPSTPTLDDETSPPKEKEKRLLPENQGKKDSIDHTLPPPPKSEIPDPTLHLELPPPPSADPTAHLQLPPPPSNDTPPNPIRRMEWAPSFGYIVELQETPNSFYVASAIALKVLELRQVRRENDPVPNLTPEFISQLPRQSKGLQEELEAIKEEMDGRGVDENHLKWMALSRMTQVPVDIYERIDGQTYVTRFSSGNKETEEESVIRLLRNNDHYDVVLTVPDNATRLPSPKIDASEEYQERYYMFDPQARIKLESLSQEPLPLRFSRAKKEGRPIVAEEPRFNPYSSPTYVYQGPLDDDESRPLTRPSRPEPAHDHEKASAAPAELASPAMTVPLPFISPESTNLDNRNLGLLESPPPFDASRTPQKPRQPEAPVQVPVFTVSGASSFERGLPAQDKGEWPAAEVLDANGKPTGEVIEALPPLISESDRQNFRNAIMFLSLLQPAKQEVAVANLPPEEDRLTTYFPPIPLSCRAEYAIPRPFYRMRDFYPVELPIPVAIGAMDPQETRIVRREEVAPPQLRVAPSNSPQVERRETPTLLGSIVGGIQSFLSNFWGAYQMGNG